MLFVSLLIQIEALPEVVRAVQNRCEVYLDGGVRSGTDVSQLSTTLSDTILKRS